MHAEDVLKIATGLVGGARKAQHGNMHVLHARIAAYWTTYVRERPDPGAAISPMDVAFMMGLLKMARAQNGNDNPDDFIDLAGYAACAAQLVLHKKTGEQTDANDDTGQEVQAR